MCLYISRTINTYNMSNHNQPTDIIDIPQIPNYDMFERNQERAYSLNLNHCPCCGKAITNPKYFINSIYGGCAYPASDKTDYRDSWVMGVGSECRKKFPTGYVFTL
jgi:hypothetical protein